MKKISYFALIATVLGACNQIPASEYYDRGSPYSLLDASSEVVNIALTSDYSITEVVQWIDQDQPTQAELHCLDGDPLCSRALEALESYRVPVNYVSAADNNLTLIYDRVVARDCDSRYIDNSINPYNLNYRGFGCSTAVNLVQMVSDKRQYTSPALLDLRDGQKAAQDYSSYLRPYDTSITGGKLTESSLIQGQGN